MPLTLVYSQSDDGLDDVLTDHPSVLLNDLVDYQLVRLDDQVFATAAAAARSKGHFAIDIEGRPLSFQLDPMEMRAPNYRRVSSTGSLFTPNSPPTQFRGTVDDRGKATFTIAPSFLMGQWKLEGHTYLLEPLWFSSPGASRDIYVSYRAADLLMPEHQCGVTHSESAAEDNIVTDKSNPGFKVVNVALVLDSLFYRKFLNADDAENYCLVLLALVQGDYDEGFDERIQFQLSTLLLSRDGNPEGWSTALNAEILLENFKNFGNSPAFDEDYDVATLMTGRDLSGNIIGFAHIDAICDTNRYNIVQNYYRIPYGQRAIWSHELGHNFGAQHVREGSFIMSPTSEQDDDLWASTTISAIEGKLEGYDCLESFGWQYLRLNTLPNGVRLNWEFAAENPHDGFLIQRAVDPDGPWTDLGRVPDSASDQFFEADTDLTYGQVYYYRLIQFAPDGTPCISETRKINVPYIDQGRLSPNPTFAQVRVYSPSIQPLNYKMYDAVGRLLWRGEISEGSNFIDLSNYPAGVYIFVEESGQDKITVERIIKQ